MHFVLKKTTAEDLINFFNKNNNMKIQLVTLQEAKEIDWVYDLSNHLQKQKNLTEILYSLFGLDFPEDPPDTPVNGAGVEITVKTWDGELVPVNSQGEKLSIVLLDGKYWIPYVEYQAISGVSQCYNILSFEMGYVYGTASPFGIFDEPGKMSESMRPGYQVWMEFDRPIRENPTKQNFTKKVSDYTNLKQQ